jgi:hypothetical protein
MYLYNSAVEQVISTVDEYHAVVGLLQNSCDVGTTFLSSATGAITDTANNGGVLRCTDAGHGLSTGQYLTVVGMADAAHNGITRVTVIDVDTFDCDNIVYNSDSDTGNWLRGTSITIDDGYQNTVAVDFSASITSVGNLKNYKFEIFKNIVEQNEYVAERKIGTASDLGTVSAGGVVSLVPGDTIWWAVMNTVDAVNYVIKHCNVHFH